MTRPTSPLPVPPPPGRPGGLGEKAETTIQRALTFVYNAFRDGLVDLLSSGLELFLEVLEATLAPRMAPIIDDILAAGELPGSVRTYLEELKSPSDQSQAMGLGAISGSVATGMVSALVGPFARSIGYGVEMGVRSSRMGPAPRFAAEWRGLTQEFDLTTTLASLGWHDKDIAAWEEILRPRLSPADLLADELRSGLPQSIASGELLARGYTPEDIVVARRLARLIPGPSDLISMAVREAWDEEVAARWGYDADFPTPFGEWMERLGDKDGWARKYWRAHWDLPGLSTVLEILHRVDAFDLEDLGTFLKTADFPVTWRAYIKQIAYVPLTRVDVRRMYGLGVLSRAEVKRNYLDLGYNDRDAERMTEFSVRYETDAERSVTKTDILSGLELGMLTEAEASEWLRSIGYPSEIAGYLVAREAAKIERKQISAWVKHIKELFTHREIDLSEASSRLNALGLASGEVSRYLEEWSIALEAREQRPSRATLQSFFKQDVVSEEEFLAGLRVLGYQEKYVRWYLVSTLADKEEEARKAEDAARKEQEDVRTRKVRSDYQIAKAVLDVDVSELRTAIAETQVALEARRRRYRREIDIVQAALTEAELKALAAGDIEDLQGQVAGYEEAIKFLEERIEALETEIAAIKLQVLVEPPEIEPERAVTLILEHQHTIETLQDEIAAARTGIVQLKDQVRARRARLQEDIDVVARLRSIQEIETEYLTDQETMQTRLSDLRINLAELREQKAILNVGYREGLLT